MTAVPTSGVLSHQDVSALEQTDAESDSICSDTVVPPPPTMADLASTAYKRLKLVQYDGELEQNIYPLALETAGLAMQALADRDLEDDAFRMKGILLDVYPLLRDGTYYYSNTRQDEEKNAMATACVDMRMMPQMEGALIKEDPKLYPMLVHMAAASAYNAGDRERALLYFDEYWATGDTQYREQQLLFTAQASMAVGDYSRAQRLAEATEEYPSNLNMLMVAIQMGLDGDRGDLLPPLLEKALSLRPDDEKLINIQARLLESGGDFNGALSLWVRLAEMRPDNLGVARHVALCYYNLAAEHRNRSIMETDEKTARRHGRQADAYFQSAIRPLEEVIANDPTDVKSLRALAITYGCLGREENLAEINTRLQALGQKPMAMNTMPETITYDTVTGTVASRHDNGGVPDFQEFAGRYVDEGLRQWTARGEFEKMSDFEQRLTPQSVGEKYRSLCREAEADYIRRYASRMRISDLELMPYDADNETYQIRTGYGPIVVKVPIKNQEAEAFKSTWQTVQINNPTYYIRDNAVAIASLDLVTSAGKTYRYRSERAADYDYTDVKVDINSYLGHEQGKGKRQNMADNQPAEKVVRAKSDVDINIPKTSRLASNRVAVVIANENYKRVAQVESAINDGQIFARYCNLTLGVPEEQVLYFENLTYAEMLSAVSRIKPLVNSLGGDAEVIFYYSGHGVPDEAGREAYLLPVDADGLSTLSSYGLGKLYGELGSCGASGVMVFLDACFSGMSRDDKPLHSARGAAKAPRSATPEGDLFVLSAAGDAETAMPYREKNHGLFTYFLLKKLQESKGNVTLRELSDYVTENVMRSSVLVNSKPQTPTTSVWGSMLETWATKKMK